MKIHHFAISLLNKIFFRYFFKKPQLRVLTFHHINEKNFDLVKKNLLDLKKNYEILDPDNFFHIIKNKKQLDKNSILLTFDDGYYSQKNFAERVLSELKIKAIFFIIPNFLKIKNISKSKKFIYKNINKFIDFSKFDFSMRNMSIDDLKYLKNKGHHIGMHTLNHKNLSFIRNKNILRKEIFSDLSFFKKLLKLKSPLSFAYPFGNISSINHSSVEIIYKYYDCIFSGVRGDNSNLDMKDILLRDAITDKDDFNLIESFLNGISDFYYKSDRKKLDLLIK